MKTSLLALLLFTVAAPGTQYQFPRDHFSHPDYQTEWWYYTGNLRAANGHRFGFELTFFRSAFALPKDAPTVAPEWRPDQIYLAHLALSDLDGRRFYSQERINRAGPGIAGASEESGRVWNGNWAVSWGTGAQQTLDAVTDKLQLALQLSPLKPVVVNGENGVDRKGPLPGEASHYLSFTRLRTSGSIRWENQSFTVEGQSWMDHEYFSEPSDTTLAGWDWFSVQLDNHQELMLYRLRRKTGGPDPYSSGTYVDRAGVAHHLNASQFSLEPGGAWRSSASHAQYPTDWRIQVPSLNLSLTESTALPDQELLSRSGATPSYWEGAVEYRGSMAKNAVSGRGYLEMTGYGKPVWLGTH